MDQHALLLQTLIDSVKNLTNEVSSLKNKVEALEEENKNLKQQLNLTTFVPLEDCRDEYPEDPKFQQLFSDFDQVPYEEQKELDDYRKEVEHKWKVKDYLKCIPAIKVNAYQQLKFYSMNLRRKKKFKLLKKKNKKFKLLKKKKNKKLKKIL